MNFSRRLLTLERARVDASALTPHSDAWFAFYEDKFLRLMEGENIGNIRIPLAVTDRMIAAADREEQAPTG